MNSFLEVRHIKKSYAHHVALNDVNLSLKEGRIFGLLGPNGAGKTTLIRIINRITMPDFGEVYFDGHPSQPDDVLRIGYLPEERGLYRKMKIGEQAVYLAQLKGLSHSEAVKRLREWFEKFDILSWWDKKLEELSKGMQQKVQFIITVVHRPSLLIFDEPFSGFDPMNTEQLQQEMLALKAEGHTIIFSTHNMESVETLCDDFALINKSQVVLQGKVDEVQRQFRSGLYEVTSLTGNLVAGACFKIISEDKKDDLTHYLLQKSDSISLREFVTSLNNQVELHSFREQLPSMKDIFLQTIGNAPHTSSYENE